MQLNLDVTKHDYTAWKSSTLTSFPGVRFLLDCVLGVSSKCPSSLFWDFVLDLAEENISYTAQNDKSVYWTDSTWHNWQKPRVKKIR